MGEVLKNYDVMISSGRRALFNYLVFSFPPARTAFHWLWTRTVPQKEKIEGLNLPNARAVKQAVQIPVICTGGFQTATAIRGAINRGDSDAVSIARGLVANNNLVQLFAEGHESPPNPCTYCNKCAINTLKNPVGCYEESRFASREEMLREIMSVYDPPPFS